MDDMIYHAFFKKLILQFSDIARKNLKLLLKVILHVLHSSIFDGSLLKFEESFHWSQWNADAPLESLKKNKSK